MNEPIRVFVGPGDLPGKRANNIRPFRESSRTWSAKDDDHIPRGRQVLLRREPKQIHASLVHLGALTNGASVPATRALMGTIERRHMDGSYMVHLNGTRLSVAVDREDLVFPVPVNVTTLTA